MWPTRAFQWRGCGRAADINAGGCASRGGRTFDACATEMGLQFDVAIFREAVRAVTSESADCEAMAVTANRTRARMF